MSLAIKQLNADASFLLSFRPPTTQCGPDAEPRPFTILTDPWLTGTSKIFHPALAETSHRGGACISSLEGIEEPDLVIISQHRSDHCNEATLRQLPRTGTKTRILAVPSAAKEIRSWDYFDKTKVSTIPRWGEDSFQASSKDAVVRVEIPPGAAEEEPGEVTVAFIPQRRDVSGLHAAIGITYRPPAPAPSKNIPEASFTPPATPSTTPVYRSALPSTLTPPTPPLSPRSTRSMRSIHSMRSLRSTISVRSAPAPARPILHRFLHNHRAAPAEPRTPALSVVFSPHGVSFRDLSSYASSHLAPEAALPLTALLHCFDSVSNPWWLGGNISAGAPGGTEIALALRARAWVSAHDGDKDVRGMLTKVLRARRYERDEVAEGLMPRGKGDGEETEVRRLGVGEEIRVTAGGLVDEAKEA